MNMDPQLIKASSVLTLRGQEMQVPSTAAAYFALLRYRLLVQSLGFEEEKAASPCTLVENICHRSAKAMARFEEATVAAQNAAQWALFSL